MGNIGNMGDMGSMGDMGDIVFKVEDEIFSLKAILCPAEPSSELRGRLGRVGGMMFGSG